MVPFPNVLTIAGSDSSGGAGIQADLKTFAALGAYGSSVITNVTAQNSLGITQVHPLPLEVIESQLSSVLNDTEIKAVKIGMLNTPDIIELVASILKTFQPKILVIDPVMISTSGKRLLDKNAVDFLVDKLFPIATLITPNIPEAAALLNMPENWITENLSQSAKSLSPGRAVLVKGGHLYGSSCIDTLWDGESIIEYRKDRIDTLNTHGTGCTLSSAIAAFMAHGECLDNAVNLASNYVHNAIKSAYKLNVGSGPGPLNHFFEK